MVDFKNTIRLPRTDFPMRAALASREPETISRWADRAIYEKMLEKNADNPPFVFHDGPPYANGSIHHGHVLNKVLKDIVVKHRSLKGHYVRYIPGWDCHGLPIELNAERELGKPKDDEDKLTVRKRCHDFAMHWSKTQMEELQRLGVFSLWDEAYRTITPSYERTIARALATFVERDMVYRGHKPVYWCADCATALAEAEVEHHNHESPSIYVTYPVIDRQAMHEVFGIEDDGTPLSVMIWTTTPWTLPASLVVAVNPRYQYRVFESDGQRVAIAEDMAEATFKDSRREGKPLGRAVPGEKLSNLRVRHPFIEDREVPIFLADYVTLEAGTGCVHTAPGHGQDDYVLCSAHGIDAFAPVDEKGRFTEDVPLWQGRKVWDANPDIVQFLHARGVLFNPVGQKLTHQYPMCWRCKNPIIFRATPQWFISMEKTELRERSLAEIDKTRWVPPWGHDRIYGMVENRPDWCISRQRIWGVPLPFFFCNDCGESLVDAEVVRHVADIFGKKGSDEWFRADASRLLPEGVTCKECGCSSFSKEQNIVDVWFESGVSWDAVCRDEKGLGVPVDLYLEGSDQHRGWFHTSLLTAVGTMDRAPYRTVLTHGFICNEKGEPFSKSLRNFIPPAKTINKEGAEILRLWVSYADYRSDIVFSQDIIKSLVDSYRKIRNTFRFMLGNLADFDPAEDAVSYSDMPKLDRWMLGRFAKWVKKLDRAYEEYDFHHVFHQTMELVTADLSSFYADIVKDRLYCDAPDGRSRRSAQTVLHTVLEGMLQVLSPVLSFTADEAWHYMPGSNRPESVFLTGFPKIDAAWQDEQLLERWSVLRDVRRQITKELEALRRDGAIGNSLEASVVVTASGKIYELLEETGADNLADLCLVSELFVEKGEGDVAVKAGRTEAGKCPRCWRHGHGVGESKTYPELCARCAEVVELLVERGELQVEAP